MPIINKTIRKWSSPSIGDSYFVYELKNLTTVVLGYTKNMRRHSYFESPDYPECRFQYFKKYTNDKDNWKNIFEKDILYEYYIGNEFNENKLKRENLYYIVFTNSDAFSYTGTKITFMGVYLYDKSEPELKRNIYTKEADIFDLDDTFYRKSNITLLKYLFPNINEFSTIKFKINNIYVDNEELNNDFILLSNRTKNVLLRANIFTLLQLLNSSIVELKNIKNFGSGCYNDIIYYLPQITCIYESDSKQIFSNLLENIEEELEEIKVMENNKMEESILNNTIKSNKYYNEEELNIFLDSLFESVDRKQYDFVLKLVLYIKDLEKELNK